METRRKLISIRCFIILILSFILFNPYSSGVAHAEAKFYSIQLAAFRSHNNAVDKVKDLRRSGFDAFYRSETIKGKGKWYGVFVDRYRSKHEAEKEAIILKQ